MSCPSQFPDLGPIVPVDRKKLAALVERKTDFTIDEFERIVGWSFIREAPAEKRKLAWDILNLGKQDLDRLRELYRHFPKCYVTRVRDVVLSGHSSDLAASGRDGAV